jgi:transcriptional regulator with XRE-family HTH domain
MDDLAIGRLFRQLRIRVGWRQDDVADRAGISRAAYSEIERGMIDRVPLGKLRGVAKVLEVRLDLAATWRGAAIDVVRSARHAAMAERVTRTLIDAGWEVRPEVSFNHFGERGVVDLVAWDAASMTLLLVELKTELADVPGLLAVTDRRRRLAATIAAPFGWQPRAVAQWVVVAASRTNERRLAAHRSLIRAALPGDGRLVAGWLVKPAGRLAALSFLPDSSGTSASRSAAPILRVRAARPSAERATESAKRCSKQRRASSRPVDRA